MFTNQLVFVRFWPKFSVFSASLFAWKEKVRLLYGHEKSQQVLGASRVSMAQGLPKAGEGPGYDDWSVSPFLSCEVMFESVAYKARQTNKDAERKDS